MRISINLNKKNVIEILFTVLWMTLLIPTDSFYVNYLFIGFLSIASILFNNNLAERRETIIAISFASILSIMVTLANYNIVYSFNNSIVLFILLFIILFTGILVFKNVLFMFLFSLDKLSFIMDNKKTNTIYVFVSTFLIIVIVDLLVLFFSQYPGIVTPDSVSQITQINSGVYSNHHPYWHTIIIKFFYELGYSLFGNANSAVATYSIFQILIMALIESYANMTLSQLGTKPIFNIAFCLFFAIVPYNYLYSFTMWKDVIFGGCILLFIVCLIKILNNIGNKKINYALFIISLFGFGLLRSNGWYALALTTVVFSFMLFKSNKKMVLLMTACLICTYLMEHPLLKYLNVSQPNLIESLSIPAQQIARVVTDDNDLSKNELLLLDKVIDVNKIDETYSAFISDPIKDLVREKNNQEYLSEHIVDYLRLYIDLGIRHPDLYIISWIDQTRGYYNSGYNYWNTSMGVYDNQYNIKQVEKFPPLTKIIKLQNSCHFHLAILNPIISIGMQTWIIVIYLFIGIIKKNKKVIAQTIPLLSIIASLLVATPVFSEFRYAYGVFTSILFVTFATIKFVGKEESK